jgi:hypothetical protein
MSSLYEQPADINKSDICAVCAITAMGSQYSAEEIPEVAKDTYFRYASSLLSDAAEQDPLMGMRASAALAVYLILLKSSSARTMTGKSPRAVPSSSDPFAERVQLPVLISRGGICAGRCEMRPTKAG